MTRQLNPFVLNRTGSAARGPVKDYRAVERPEEDDPKDPGTSEQPAEGALQTDVPTQQPSTPSSVRSEGEAQQESSSVGDAPSPASAKPNGSDSASTTASGEDSTSTTEKSEASTASSPTPSTPTLTVPTKPAVPTRPLKPSDVKVSQA